MDQFREHLDKLIRIFTFVNTCHSSGVTMPLPSSMRTGLCSSATPVLCCFLLSSISMISFIKRCQKVVLPDRGIPRLMNLTERTFNVFFPLMISSYSLLCWFLLTSVKAAVEQNTCVLDANSAVRQVATVLLGVQVSVTLVNPDRVNPKPR